VPDRKLNATAASLLGFLHRGPMSGWDLAATAQHVIGDFWSLTRSQVYRELAWMAEAGLVRAGERGSRDRQPFELTDAGRAAFSAWAETEPGPETIRFPLLLTISFGRHVPPERLAAFITSHRETHARRLADYEAHLGDGDSEERDPYREATLAFGLAYERAVLAWFDDLPTEITQPRRPSRRSVGARRGP
jgi:DNA-binding PadR family transcriptional regulator